MSPEAGHARRRYGGARWLLTKENPVWRHAHNRTRGFPLICFNSFYRSGFYSVPDRVFMLFFFFNLDSALFPIQIPYSFIG